MSFENLAREIENCGEEYSWAIRTLIHKDLARGLLSFFAFIAVFCVLFFQIQYWTAKNSTVSFDTNIIVSGDAFYQKLKHAIKSNSQEEKLDVLLLDIIKSFRPSNGPLNFYLRGIWFSFFLMITILILIFLIKKLYKLYPLSYFAFSWSQKTLEHIRRKREVISVVVVLGFLINIAAGIVLTIFKF